MNKGSEDLEPIIIRDRKLGNLALEMVPGEQDRRKCDSKKKIEKHSACIVCSEKDRI